MKKIWLMGGLGNVLFQVLGGKILRKYKNQKVYYVDLLTKKNFLTGVLKWKIHDKLYYDIIKESEIKNPNSLIALVTVLVALISKIFKTENVYSTFYLNDHLKDSSLKSYNIFSYFQSKEFLSTYQKDLILFGKELNQQFSTYSTCEIVVHYRKGDSVWATDKYYNKVKGQLRNYMGKPSIIIVTDCYKDAVLYFAEIDNCKVVKSNNALDDFIHMISAKVLFCAPSTFSWWAAHSLSEKSIIYFPKFLVDRLGVYVINEYHIIGE